ncbi:putative Calpain [Leptomonas pyrrhocoris]|uniref:Putative Calpain n=1 Tax=Leptomonas pyrrhocoris TaxID=157538 RepID=A0A0M9FXI5_LEPPY|nr:putative Calpain [Leptomonas pyrrhocoris]XP_015656555.1 putative Calpain [Leptomonas pyrrhocoris]KPA78115.1 putative Calpain [Leptomonas pyrrhocoris]KPA78116.1 putative Calpain [Leptomonas pyrrhocoris]|eukprot:XP_015656554.1 putative Calpain [Leptomonas pyrrhocoris]
MPSHAELYDYYCRRSACHPNSSVQQLLEDSGSSVLDALDVSGNYLGPRGLLPVLDLVKNTKTIHTLDVSNNELGLDQVQHLAYCLALHPSIRRVRLCNAGLHDGHADVLLQLLFMNTSIEELILEGNYLTPPCLKVLEAALTRNRTAQQLRRTEEKAHAAYLSEKAATSAMTKRTFSAALSGSIPAAESGGYVHFATWFKNPQFCVQMSRASSVSFVLECTQEDTGVNQMGLMVLRHDGVHRAVEITDATVVAESPVTDRHCVVHAFLNCEESYVVMPYTFNPGRALQFRLTATLINDRAAQEEGWITLEKLDARYDWCTCSIEDGEWTTANAGGGGRHTTWRRNDMYHLTNCSTDAKTDGSDNRASAATASSLPNDGTTATIYVVLIKEADPYRNDDRAIGIDVVAHDVHNPNAPPLFYSSDVVCASLPHVPASFALLKVQLPASNLDVYVVPSTELPGQTGTYTLTVLSSIAVQLTQSSFPHAWRYRIMNGIWDETCCGGCRAECLSWKNNPSVEVHVEEVAQPLIACVELRTMTATAVDPEVSLSPAHAPAATAEVEKRDGILDSARRQAELMAFRQRHRTQRLEVGVMAVDTVAPAFTTLATSAQSEHAASVVVSPTHPDLYIVPMLRHPADIAVYTLELFSPSPFVVESVDAVCLATRERQAQLAAYASESEQRAAILQAADEQQQQSGEGPHDSVSLQAERMTILEKVSQTGLPFVDRDFPRGISSLFLDPEGPLPLDLPVQTTWKRVSELSQPRVREVNPANMCPPYQYSPRHWFASVLQAVAAKPGWLARIFVHYAREAGFAQFAFFKQDDWVGVTIDDYLLVDNQDELVYGRSSRSSDGAQDFFFPLAEKAYAKLHRCYEALEPKANPDQTTPDLLCQGLMDVTSGFTSVVQIRSCGKSDEMPADEKDQLWRTLKCAIEPSLLCSFMLDNGGAVTRERSHVGLLPDRLYGVIDARFVEQQRLVKIRLLASADGDDEWKGKWTFDSPRWTATLRDVLNYHTAEPHAAWLHFDEALYYFTHVFVTEVCPRKVSVVGSFAEPMDHDPERATVSLRNPQFALTVTPTSTANDTAVEVHVGVHRRDPRLDITRAKGATAQLKTWLGFAVFATDDNARRLSGVTDDELLQLVKPSVKRDQYVTLHLTAGFLRTRKITVMPFRENLRDPDVSYVLSASCAAATSAAVAAVQLTHVAPNTSTTISGRWDAGVKAGPPTFPQWRNNPQFFLSAAQEVEVTVTLRPTCTTTATLGFTLHHTRRCSSFLNFDPATVVASAFSDVAGAAPSCVVRLAGMTERRGMPYVLVPYTSDDAGEFQLEVVCNQPVQLRSIDPRLDWHRVCRTVSINAADGNTGGNPAAFPSWRFNTQLVLTFPVERDGRLFISAKRVRSADPRVKIGMLLLRAGSAVAGSYQRRVTFSEDDVVVRSADGPAESVVDTDVTLLGDREALILVVYADQPYKEADVELSFYSVPTLEVQPVTEWPKVLMQEGSWELGTTAAGSRENFASWINNPFFGLSVLRPTKVTLLLVQYPRDHEHPVVKRHGAQKTFLPPPLVHPDRCTAIQLSVAKYDATLTEVVSTTPTTNADTCVTVELSPEQPYLVVPCTQEPQHDGDFKLFAFADYPIELYVAEKPRLPYV